MSFLCLAQINKFQTEEKNASKKTFGLKLSNFQKVGTLIRTIPLPQNTKMGVYERTEVALKCMKVCIAISYSIFQLCGCNQLLSVSRLGVIY